MSASIFIREVDMKGYVTNEDGSVLSLTLSDGLRFPNLVAAREAFERIPEGHRVGSRYELVAADPEESSDERDIEPMGELDELDEITQTPLRGAVELFAMLRKASKYHGQFPGWAKVDSISAPSHGDPYCFRAAHNAYRHEDLIFGVKVGGEMMRLDRFAAVKERRVAA